MIYSALVVAERASAFAKSVAGSTLIQQGTGIIAQKAGALAGAAFPEAAVGFAAGQAVANRLVGESENKSKIAFGVGVAGALTATALAQGLSYLTGGDCGAALDYMVTSSGIIAGGMTALQAVGQEVTVDYIPRMAASMVAGDVVGGAISGAVEGGVEALANAVSSNSVAGAAIGAIGAVAQPVLGGVGGVVAGTAAYYAPETARVVDAIVHSQPPVRNHYDPGEFIQTVAQQASGSTEAFSASMASQVVNSPFVSSIVQSLLQHTIDKKLPTNALIRAVNDYVTIIQQPSVQEKIAAFKASATPENKQALKREISRLVKETFSAPEKAVASAIKLASNSATASLVDQLVDVIKKQEVECFSLNLSDTEQTRNMLHALLPSLIPFVAVYAKRETMAAKELTHEEINTFYQNITKIALAPYNEYKVVQGAERLVSAAIPLMQRRAQFIPKLLAKTIGETLAESMQVPEKQVEPQPAKTFLQSLAARVPFLGTLFNALGITKLFQIVKGFFVDVSTKVVAPTEEVDEDDFVVDWPPKEEAVEEVEIFEDAEELIEDVAVPADDVDNQPRGMLEDID